MRVLFTALLTLCVTAFQAQFLAPGNFDPAPDGYCVSIEEITSHDSGELAGQTTYRLYLNCLNPSDYLGGCAGDANNPLIIESTSGDWYNNPFNSSWNASSISEVIVGLLPEVVYDSYLTIGADNAETTAAGMSTIWGDIDASLEFTGGDAGQNVTVNDVTGGAWYEPFEGVEANQTGLAGDDLKIMFAQITTSGTLSGQVYFSVYMNGDQEQEWRDVLAFDSCPILGCTDSTACNYDVEATEDDGSCAELDCAGVCGGDAVLDTCDICNGPGAVYECGCADIAEGACDCDGNVLDECGVCGGEGIADGACDCDGNVLDECGICGGDGIADGECNCAGDVEDECGVCGGEGIADGACDCDGNVLDDCGVCGGEGIADGACDCEGNVLDECGVCGGEGIAEGACDCSGNVLDECGVCGGEGIADGACDCEGNVLDECGVCGGDGIAEGECNCDGDVEDECGVCGGDGIPDGACDCDGSVLDECGVCGGEGIADGACDCDGNVLDECGVCGGEGIADGACDCDGNVLDECGNCGGDGAGTPVNDDCDGALMIGCGMTVEGSTLCASVSNNPCVNGRKGVWYTFEGIGAEVGLSLCSFGAVEENGYDTRLLLFSGGCDALHCEVNNDDFFGQNLPNGVPWACAETSNGLNSGIGFFSEAGVTYHIMVTSFASHQTGDYEFTLSCDMMEDCCETELTWNQELSDAIVECVEDLPMTCEDFTTGLMAINECDESEYEAVCTPLLSLDNQEVSSGVATTAKRNESLGEDEYDYSDAAIRLYGLSASGIADSDYFVEDPSAPLSWNYYPESGTATLTGRVYCRENSARWFDLNAAFEDALNAQDWMDLDSDNTLLVNTDPNNPGATCDYDAENMTVFLMQPGSSYLLADGESNELNGLIGLDHMPLSLNKRFQYGPQANNHNCGYGLGGWFRWDGILNGEEVSGFSGDIVVDIEESSNDASCSESACFDYTALDFGCGRALTERFCVNREDTTPPLITEGPLDVTVECDAVPEMAGTDAIVANDNCSGDLSYAEGTELRIDGDCPTEYFLIRKWDVTDACGLTSTWTQNITVQDTTAPSLMEASDETVECDGMSNMDALNAWLQNHGGATATDNCDDDAGLELSWSDDFEGLSDDCGATGSALVTFTVTDCAGNSSSSTATFTIQDTTAPAITAEMSIMKNCEAYSAEDSYGSNAEDCGMGSFTWVDAPVSGGCIMPIGAYLRTYSATDDCGNTSTAEQIITLVDDVAPVIDMEAADQTVECDGMGNMDALNAWLDINGGASATDNCSNIEWNSDFEGLSDDCGATGSVTVTFTATDDCDNANSTTATFTIEDTTAPDMTEASDQTVECDGMGNMDALNAWLDSYGGATASDICSGVTWSSDYEGLSDGCGATGSANVTFTATDDCGNASSTTATFTIEDATNPAITAASDQTVECDGMGNMDALNGWLDNNGGATASDVCSGVTWSNDFEGLSDDCGATGSSTVTFTATDDCGNASSVSATFTIEDTTDPVFEPFMSTIMVECTEGDYSSPDYQPLTATDHCSGVEYDIQSVCMSGGCLWTVMRIWTATDDCGNSTTVEQFIMLIDTTAPVVTAPAPYNVDADADDCSADISATADVAGFATVQDNCGDVDCWGMESITVWSEDAELEAICGYGMDDQGSRSIVRTWYAQDRCGNIGQDTQIITISDVTPPVASVTDESVACADYDPTMEYGMTMSSDNCAAQPTYTWENTETIQGDCAGSYMVKRTYTFVDDCENTVDVVQTITVFDDVAPVISGENQVDVECSSDYANTVFITASDACGSGAEISFSDVPVSGGCVQPVGMYQRMYSVTDDCGNVATFEQFVRLLDTTAPELTIPEDYTIECDQDIVYDDASATDNCDGSVAMGYSEEVVAGDCPQSYEIKRTFTATDDCDNSVSATQTITVQDTTAPELTVPEDYTAECSDVHPLEDASATDNCGMVSIAMDADTVAGACAQSYVVTRTFTASDECGNEATLSQTITIEDTTAPLFNEALPGDMTAECDDVPEASVLTAMDNCQDDVTVSYSESRSDGDCPSNYTLTRVWSVSDDCDNVTDHTQVLTIQDTTAPELSIPADYTAECSDEHPLEDASATDNCGEVSIVMDADTAAGACDQAYVVIRTFTASDECGNETTLYQTIVIEDTTSPEISADTEAFVACSDYDVNVAYATTTDNCGMVDLSWTDAPVSGGCVLPIGQYVRNYTATDECGNASTFEQILTLTDEVDPEFTSVPEGATYECFEEIEYLDATATDNCSGATVGVVADTVFSNDCMQTFTITRTFTATDNCGNSATATQVIEVQDTEGPDFTFVPEDYTAECSDELTLADAMAIDHCSMVNIEVNTTEIPGTCEGHYTILREFVATDDCGNQASQTQVITIQDTTAPELSIPGDYTAECSDEHPLEDASATDNCSMVSIVMDADTAAGACAQSYVVTRTFTATDECGNSTSLSQVITIQDTTAPELTIPADYIAECDEELVFDDASASDNCGTLSIVLEETTNETDCAQEYSIVRTFTATDECGNSSVASQTITVVDTTDPVIASAGGLMNGQVVEVCCESLEGGITVPEAVELVYSDNCDDAANLDYNEECIGGNCPTVDVESWCEVSNPAVMPDGETCDNYSVHSMRLFNFPGSEFYTTIEGRVANNVDGTKTYTMTVVSSDNDAAGWEITNNYSAPMSWEDWIAQPGSQSYKSDCGLGDHTEWMYTMLTSGSATGWGDYAGSSLTFNHQPASGYFGFQIGEGANNKNGNYGFSAWMYYNGIFDGSPVSGSGDVFGDLDCCLPYDLSRNYVVTDCAGNDTEFGYTVRMTGEDCASGDAGDISVPEDSDLTFVKDLVKIASLQPNPTSDMSTLVLTTEEPSLQVEVAVMTMTGSTVMTLYNGPVVAGWPTIIEVPAFQLESGMYQVKARAKTYVTTKKLLVAN